jgi:hypothetical protein
MAEIGKRPALPFWHYLVPDHTSVDFFPFFGAFGCLPGVRYNDMQPVQKIFSLP